MEAALNLIRQRVQETGRLDMVWMERALREAAMADAARLLEKFLNHEVAPMLGEPPLQPGERLHSRPQRVVATVLGPVRLTRAYYRGAHGGRFPLDEALGLRGRYTPAVRQLMCWAGAMDGSFDLASETLRRFAGLDIPGRQIQRMVNATAPTAADWMQTRPAAPLPRPPAILNIQTDMTGIPMRPEELAGITGKQPDGTAKTRQIKVGCVFTQTCDAKGQPQRDPSSSLYLTGFCEVTDFGLRLREEARRQGLAGAGTVVFLGDGAEWIWNLASDCFRGAVQIVDFYHACEHLHRLCTLYESDEQRCASLFKKWRGRLRNNGLARLLGEVEARAHALDKTAREQLVAETAYFRKNAARMAYRTFRRRGYFIGSGAVEGACRHVVAQRTKLSGMRWFCCGAENVLTFRTLIKSHLFDDYYRLSAAA